MDAEITSPTREQARPWVAEGGSRWENYSDARRWAGIFGNVWFDDGSLVSTSETSKTNG